MTMHKASPESKDLQEDLGTVTPMDAFVARARRVRDRQEANSDTGRPESWAEPDPEAIRALPRRKHPVHAVLDRKGGLPKSRDTFRLVLRRCCERLQGLEARSLSMTDVENYPWHHVDADLAAQYAREVYAAYDVIATRNDNISPLRQIITACCSAGLISVARRDEVLEELPTVAPGESRKRRRLANVEITALLMACQDGTDEGTRDAALIALFATTGIRISEAVAIRVSDWDVAADTIVIRSPKNGRRHVVFVHPVTKEYLLRWTTRRGTDDPEGALFSWPGGPRKGAPVCTDTARSWIRRRQVAAGVAPFGTHDFRRTFASTLLRTHDLALVGRLLNHTKPTSTLIYDLASDDEQRNAVGSIALTDLLPPDQVDTDEDDADQERSA